MTKTSTSEVLAARQQLLHAVRELPLASATSLLAFTANAPSIDEIDDRVGPRGEVSVIEDIPVTFFRERLHGRPVWRFEGSLSVLIGDEEEARMLGDLNAWVRAELGERCLEVVVHEPVDEVSAAVIHFA